MFFQVIFLELYVKFPLLKNSLQEKLPNKIAYILGNMTSVNCTLHLLTSPESDEHLNNRTESIQTTTSETFSLLSETFSEAASVFTCSYDQHPTSSLCNAVGVCYLGSSSSNVDEAHGRGLYLSSLFFGSEVIGIHHSDSSIPSIGSVLISPIVKALLDTWRTYLEEHPGRNLLQCFYGDGGHAVAKALQLTPYAQRITVVGVQSPIPIPHRSAYLFQTKPHCLTQNIQDPVFAPCLLRAFHETLTTSESEISHRHRCSFVMTLENDSQDEDWIDADTTKTLANSDFWTESRLSHALNLTLAAYRVTNYIYLMIFPSPEQLATEATPPQSLRSESRLLSIGNSISTVTGESSATHSSVTTTSLLPTASPTTTHEYPQYIYPCGIFPNGTFPNGIDPFNGTFSNNTFPYPAHFSGELLNLIHNCSVYYDFTTSNTISRYPYGLDRFGRFTYKQNTTEQNTTYINWPYQCRGWIDPKTINTSDTHKIWDVLVNPFNYSLFFGGGLINLEMPGEEHLFPCGIRPNGSFTGAYLNINISDEYPYGQFPNNDFPYLSYFFNSSFNYGEEYSQNRDRNVSLLAGSQNYYNSSLTPLLNCTTLGSCISSFNGMNITCTNSTLEDYLDYDDSSGGGDYYNEPIGNTTLDWISKNMGCLWDWDEPKTLFIKPTTTTEIPTTTTKALTTHIDKTSTTHTINTPTTYTVTHHPHSSLDPIGGLAVASRSASRSDQTILILTGYWISQGICEAILLRTTSSKGQRRVKAFSLAITSSLILGNVADLASNLWEAFQGKNSNLCTPDIVIRGSLCAYDVINLASETVRFASPSIRKVVNKVKAHSIESLPIIEKTTEKVKEGVGKMDRAYRKNARKTNLTLSSVGMALAGVVALGSGISILTTKEERNSSAYFLTIQSLAVAAFSALFFRIYRS